MAQEVGVAYVTLLPSGRGFGKAVEGQVDDAVSKSEKKTDGFFSKLGKGIKTAAVGVAAVATGVAALAITGGISRALNIEDAQAKLKGLGHDTQSVEAIMKDALASVKGTAFGLDAAATTAAAAVASGIKPGKELEGYLRLTADAATIAGVSMEEMGSIMNKVQAKGKAQMEDLNRLTERGIPIMQMLADEYGVTAEEMSAMVSRGEVDSERFRKALEDNVGGAALASGDTTRGAFANMMAALSRLGLVFVGPALEHAKTFFNEVTVILDGLGERLGPVVDRINDKLSEMFNPEGMGEGFLAWFDGLVDAVESGPIPQLLEALAPILPVLGEAARLIGSALGDAFFELGNALAPVLPLLAEELADAVVELAPSLADLLVALIPLIPPLVELLAVVAPLAADLVDLLLPAVTWVVDALSGFIEAFGELVALVQGDSTMSDFADKIMAIQGPFGDLLRVVGEAGFWIGVWVGNVLAKGQELYEGVVSVLTWIADFFRQTWETVGLVLGGALQVIVGLVTGNMDLVKGGIAQAVGAIRAWWDGLWNSVGPVVQEAWNNVVSSVSLGVANVMGFIGSLPNRIMTALAGAGSWLVQTGRDIIQGLINGVGSMIGAAVSSVQAVGGAMLDGVKSFLGIHSPSRVFRDEVGKMVGLGLLEGVEDRAIRGRINTAVDHLVSIPETASVTPGAAGPLVGSMTFQSKDESGVIRDLMFALRTTARGGVYGR